MGNFTALRLETSASDVGTPISRHRNIEVSVNTFEHGLRIYIYI